MAIFSAADEVSTGLPESNGNLYHRGFGRLQTDCLETAISSGPEAPMQILQYAINAIEIPTIR